MVTTMRNWFVAALLLAVIGSAEAQTFGSSTVETTPTTLSAVSTVFTPPCPTLGGGFAVHNIVVTAASQSIALPTSCPSSSVGLFVTLNICNGKSGTAPCNGTATGPFSPGISFATPGFEFPGTTSFTETQTSGAKDIVTCEVMGTTGPWSCGTPQYAVAAPPSGLTLVAHASCASAAGGNCTTTATDFSQADLIVTCDGYLNSGGTATNAPQDSQSNTYTDVFNTGSVSNNLFLRMSYKQAPSVSATMTFTATNTNGNAFPGLAVMGFKGSVATPLDQSNHATAGGVATLATGSITPTTNNQLVAACATVNSGAGSFSINSSMTITDAVNSTGNNEAAVAAYIFQTTAAAINPTYSWTNSGDAVADVGSFK